MAVFQYVQAMKARCGRVVTALWMLVLSVPLLGQQQVTVYPADRNFASKAAGMFDRQPDAAKCYPGALKQAERDAAVATLNQIRALHGLQPVVYDLGGEPEVMAAALMMAANGDLDHRPPTSWRCYSALGAKGAGSSNLSGGTVSPWLSFSSTRDEIIGWVTDERNAVPGVGHRLWLLSPFLTQLSYGASAWEYPDGKRTAAAAAKVFDFGSAKPVPTKMPAFVAYPFGDYPMVFHAASALHSFSPIVDPTNQWENIKADLSKAAVRITSVGQAVPVEIVRRSNDAVGGMSAIEFRTPPLIVGQTYNVEITGITFRQMPLNYSYSFRLVGNP